MRESYNEYIYYDKPFTRTFMMPAIMPNNANDNFYGKQQTIYKNKFVDPQEGFLRGNMEAGTYVPYKNMTYIIPTIKDEKQRSLYQLQQMAFAAHDANLYLDTHPEDTNMINQYNEYLRKEKKLNDEYERKYGPIDLSDNEGLGMTPWAWIKEPWPWNK